MHTGPNIPACEGALLSLFCDRCTPGLEAEHSHEELQLSLIFESVVCDLSWRDIGGDWHEEHIVGPQFLLVGPGVPHTCRWRCVSDAVILYIESALRESLLPDGVRSFLTSSSIAGASTDIVVWQLAAALQRIRSEKASPDSTLLHSVAVSVARRALAVLRGAVVQAASCAPRLSRDRMRIMDEFIELNLGNEINVDDIARRVGISVPHLTALCSATVSMPPHKYLVRRRMLRALEMLKTGKHRVAEVALAVGFQDQGYFGSRFKEHFSCTPRSVLLRGYAEPEEGPNKP